MTMVEVKRKEKEKEKEDKPENENEEETKHHTGLPRFVLQFPVEEVEDEFCDENDEDGGDKNKNQDSWIHCSPIPRESSKRSKFTFDHVINQDEEEEEEEESE